MPTLPQYRQLAAKLAGRFISGTVNSSGSTTTTFVVDALKSSLSADNIYADYFVYFPAASAADKIRVVSSFTASTGTITVDRAYSGTNVANSKAFELHGTTRPFADDLGENGDWTDLVNAALKRTWLDVEITATAVVNQNRYDLTTANTWLTNADWVRQVGYLSSTESRLEVDPYIGREVLGEAYKSSNLVYLRTERTFQTTETPYIRCIKSGYDHVQAAGAGSFGAQAGLALETDVAVPLLEWVAYGALVELANRQGMNLADETQTAVAKHRNEWAAMFSYYARKETEALPPRTFKPRMRIGMVRQGRAGR